MLGSVHSLDCALGEACEENGKCIAMLISPTTPVT